MEIRHFAVQSKVPWCFAVQCSTAIAPFLSHSVQVDLERVNLVLHSELVQPYLDPTRLVYIKPPLSPCFEFDLLCICTIHSFGQKEEKS